ncbi:MAG TPA: BlaI/MecI/CopY family transcriptional regulator [Candidatus Acidoferrales bacterium]|nr:BlaI/MecI/CopY family transcriptional regulator [Candidatus Acidoferrales bacterium]
MSETPAGVAFDGRGTETQVKPPEKRRSLLDLAPLELACMNALWPIGEASVRVIRAQMSTARPRAYTTIMTIMDRLARKGIVERRRVGRAWLYRPNLSAEEARAHAVAQVVEGFFGGSAEALAVQLNCSARAPASPRESKSAPAPPADDALL